MHRKNFNYKPKEILVSNMSIVEAEPEIEEQIPRKSEKLNDSHHIPAMVTRSSTFESFVDNQNQYFEYNHFVYGFTDAAPEALNH